MTLGRLCPRGHGFHTGRTCSGCNRERGSSTARGLGAEHRRIRRQVLAEETTCWLCGKPGTEADPLQADHIVARADHGSTDRSNYHAAHSSCNARRGQTPGWPNDRSDRTSGDPAPAVSRSVRDPLPPLVA